MSRFAAFGIHIGISFVILLILGALVVFVWYPGMFFETDGGWRGLRIIAAVDMVLGPALTLVVYKAGKPGLRNDLAMIGIFQFACLFAGTYLVYQERPMAVVFSDGRFYVMSSDDFGADTSNHSPDLSSIQGRSPKWVTVKLPENPEEEAELRGQLIQEGRILASAVELYINFDKNSETFRTDAVDLDKIRAKPGADAAIESWLRTYGGSIEDYAFYTFASRFRYQYIGFSRENWTLQGLLKVDVLDKKPDPEAQ